MATRLEQQLDTLAHRDVEAFSASQEAVAAEIAIHAASTSKRVRFTEDRDHFDSPLVSTSSPASSSSSLLLDDVDEDDLDEGELSAKTAEGVLRGYGYGGSLPAPQGLVRAIAIPARSRLMSLFIVQPRRRERCLRCR